MRGADRASVASVRILSPRIGEGVGLAVDGGADLVFEEGGDVVAVVTPVPRLTYAERDPYRTHRHALG